MYEDILNVYFFNSETFIIFQFFYGQYLLSPPEVRSVRIFFISVLKMYNVYLSLFAFFALGSTVYYKFDTLQK